jgi:hypothetical protein
MASTKKKNLSIINHYTFYLTMRKKLLFAIGVILASCQQITPSAWEQNPESASTETLLVNLVLPAGPSTKVLASEAKETAVNSLQIFVFKAVSETDHSKNVRETDKWDASGNTALTLSTYTGDKIIWALVNAPRQSFSNEAELLAHHSMLEENSATGLVMTGSATKKVVENNTHSSVGDITSVPITVSHLGARLSIQNVKVDFSNTSLEGCYLDIKEVYVLNAVNNVCLDGKSRTKEELKSSANWYNLEAWSGSIPTAAQSLLGDRGNLKITLGPTTGEKELNRCFYVYPNASTSNDDNTDATASARLTRIILHGYIRGEAGRKLGDNIKHAEESYYCFDIPKTSTNATLERNHSYDIQDITITMAGGPSDAPEDRPKFGKVKATITVSDWIEHTELKYEL